MVFAGRDAVERAAKGERHAPDADDADADTDADAAERVSHRPPRVTLRSHRTYTRVTTNTDSSWRIQLLARLINRWNGRARQADLTTSRKPHAPARATDYNSFSTQSKACTARS